MSVPGVNRSGDWELGKIREDVDGGVLFAWRGGVISCGRPREFMQLQAWSGRDGIGWDRYQGVAGWGSMGPDLGSREASCLRKSSTGSTAAAAADSRPSMTEP